MLVESLLPLGKLDPGLRRPDVPLDIRRFAAGARRAEAIGLDAVLVEETKDDPFQLLALATTTTSRVQLGTSVAVAFARSPTVTAMSAWSLQKASGGRFVLGLGTQVRAHVQRRYGIPWSAPAPWMRDYVGAVRAVWRCWQHGWGETAVQASALSREQRWDELAALVDDDMLHTVAAIGTFDDIADVLCQRYSSRVDRIEFSIPVVTPDDAARLREIL